MEVVAIEPRFVTREIRPSAYLVFFWEQGRGDAMPVSAEFRVNDADSIREVLDWAEREARGRDLEVFALLTDGLVVRLLGQDPTIRRKGWRSRLLLWAAHSELRVAPHLGLRTSTLVARCSE